MVPGLQMYTVIFEKGAEAVVCFHTPARTEADARERAMAFFRDNPDHDPFGGEYEGLVVRVQTAI